MNTEILVDAIGELVAENARLRKSNVELRNELEELKNTKTIPVTDWTLEIKGSSPELPEGFTGVPSGTFELQFDIDMKEALAASDMSKYCDFYTGAAWDKIDTSWQHRFDINSEMQNSIATGLAKEMCEAFDAEMIANAVDHILDTWYDDEEYGPGHIFWFADDDIQDEDDVPEFKHWWEQPQ